MCLYIKRNVTITNIKHRCKNRYDLMITSIKKNELIASSNYFLIFISFFWCILVSWSLYKITSNRCGKKIKYSYLSMFCIVRRWCRNYIRSQTSVLEKLFKQEIKTFCQNEHYLVQNWKSVVNVSAMGHVTITSALPNHLLLGRINILCIKI